MNKTNWFKILKILRISSQTVFFGLFVFVYFKSLDPFGTIFNPFLRYDPLIFLTHMNINFLIPLLILIVSSLILGRYFCGWICPLGAVIDFIGLITGPIRNLIKKYFIRKAHGMLSGNFLSKIEGYKIPAAITGAILITVFFIPPVLQFFHPNIWVVRIFSLKSAGIYFLIILLLTSLMAESFWCRYICPLGALYGILAFFSPFKLMLNKCSSCGICNSCPMDAVDYTRKIIYPDRCILCFNHEYRCPVSGFKYGFTYKKGENLIKKGTPNVPNKTPFIYNTRDNLIDGKTKGQQSSGENKKNNLSERGNITRREFISATTMVLAGGVAGGLLSLFSSGKKTSLIRPPGVIEESSFLKNCLRCFQCVVSCPNQIIKITTSPDNGFSSLLTPHLDFSAEGCDYYCQACQIVCPNYAIPLQTLEEKQRTKMGIARIDRRLCVVYSRDTNCLVCEEFCPTREKAIIVDVKEKVLENGQKITLKYPIVNRDLCIGCGICEAKCPVDPRAIKVFKDI